MRILRQALRAGRRGGRLIAAPVALGLWLSIAAASDGQMEHGLLWSRADLPAVFPLQVRSSVGQDVMLVLSDAETGRDVMAARIDGGRFFRLLVPPGRFSITFLSGETWLGPERGFEDAETLAIVGPLEFGVEGIGRKAGHLIDIRPTGEEASATTFGLCQQTATVFERETPRDDRRVFEKGYPVGQDFDDDPDEPDLWDLKPFRFDLWSRAC